MEKLKAIVEVLGYITIAMFLLCLIAVFIGLTISLIIPEKNDREVNIKRPPIPPPVRYVIESTGVRHSLKVHPKEFKAMKDCNENYDIRFDDRNYQPGDLLILCEYDPIEQRYTGRQERRYIKHVLRDIENHGLKKGYCILSF